MTETSLIALGILLGAVNCLSRSSLHLGLLGRPLALACFWGLCTGDITTALLLGLCYELLWLDAFPIGTYLPPVPSFPMLTLLTLAVIFNWTDVAFFTVLFFLTLPLAYGPVAIQTVVRTWGTRQHMLLEEAASTSTTFGNVPQRLILRSSLTLLALEAAVYTVILLMLIQSGPYIEAFLYPLARFLNAGWRELICLSSLGAFLSLRIPKSYGAFFLSFLILSCMALLR